MKKPQIEIKIIKDATAAGRRYVQIYNYDESKEYSELPWVLGQYMQLSSARELESEVMNFFNGRQPHESYDEYLDPPAELHLINDHFITYIKDESGNPVVEFVNDNYDPPRTERFTKEDFIEIIRQWRELLEKEEKNL